VAPRFVLVCLIAASSGCGWWNTPERQIRRVLDEIAERLSHDAPVDRLAAAAAAAGLQVYLAPDVVIDPGRPFERVTGRDVAGMAAARLIGSTPSLRVEFVDVHIDLRAPSGGEAADGQNRADVSCSVTTVIEDGAAHTSRDARELRLVMRVMDGRWMIEQVKAVSALEPVP
jgi:hypothetical protein